MNTREQEDSYRILENFLFNPNSLPPNSNEEIIGWINYDPKTGEETFKENPNYKSQD